MFERAPKIAALFVAVLFFSLLCFGLTASSARAEITITVDSTYSGSTITVDGIQYDSFPASIDVDYGIHTFAAQQEAFVVVGQDRYIFQEWYDGNTNATRDIDIQSGFDTSQNIRAIYRHEYCLDVISSQGNVSGDDTGWYTAGATIETGISGPVNPGIDTRRYVRGWTATGSAPASGSTPDIPPFQLNFYTQIVWDWEIQYKLSMQGAISPFLVQPWLVLQR
ncbi:MAG: hypothetical protein U5N86_08495 [Planctomycetota bacterium]|nr:hypothetical protein [Planctomycetota bacterium]